MSQSSTTSCCFSRGIFGERASLAWPARPVSIQGHYSRVERGLLNAEPSPATIEAIAKALKFPVSFFTQNDELSGLPLAYDVAWRKKASVNASDMKRLHAELNLRIMHLRRYLNSVDVTPELPLPKVDALDMGGAQKVAQFIRRTWMIPNGPIKNLTALCETCWNHWLSVHFPSRLMASRCTSGMCLRSFF